MSFFKIFRILAAFSVLTAGVAAVSYMQKRFDDADLRKALAAVRRTVPNTTPCQAKIVSRFRGEVQVLCEGQGGSGFLVDVVRGVVVLKH